MADSTRKNIYFKNGRVLEAVLSKPKGEQSDFIEQCVLFYLDRDKVDYVLTEDLNQTNKQVKQLNQNYLQVMDIVEDIVAELCKIKKGNL